MARKRGRPRKIGERYANGRLKPPVRESNAIAPALLHRIREHGKRLGADPKLATELGRLLLLEKVTSTEAAAGFKLAELYGRWGYYHGRKRVAKSSAYESGFQAASNWDAGDDDPDYEHKFYSVAEAFKSLPIQAPGFSASARATVERLCVEDESLTASELVTARALLAVLGEHFGIVKAPPKKSNVIKLPSRKSAVVNPGLNNRPAQRDRQSWIMVMRKLRPDLSDEQSLEAFNIYRALSAREHFRQNKADHHNQLRLAI